MGAGRELNEAVFLATADKAGVVPQAAGIPFVIDEDGLIQVLMTLRAGREKWGVPKGCVEPGDTLTDTVLAEAREEAGVTGLVLDRPVGMFTFRKRKRTCRVVVFLMEVTEQFDAYEEEEIRYREWFELAEAAELPMRAPLRKIIKQLETLIREHRG